MAKAVGNADTGYLTTLAKRYANLHDQATEIADEIKQCGNELKARLSTFQCVHITPTIVVAKVSKTKDRRPITQKMLRDAGATEAVMSAVLKASAPKGRYDAIKVMLDTAFRAMRPKEDKKGESEDEDGEED